MSKKNQRKNKRPRKDKREAERIARQHYDNHPLKGKTIALCLPGDTFTNGFVLSISPLIHHMLLRGIKYRIYNHRAADMNNCRNKIVLAGGTAGDEALPFGGAHYDYCLWIDSDMTFTFEDLETLVSRDKDIIGGAYASDPTSLIAGMLTPKGQARLHVQNLASDDLISVDYIGFGFVLIKQGVLEHIGFPWFEHRMIEYSEAAVKTHSSEDVAFCDKAKQDYGYEIWLDPNVALGHQKRVTYPLADWRPQIKKKAEEANNG